MENLDILSNAISAIIGALAGGLPTFLYFRQEKNKRELENDQTALANESTQSDEWRKLYLESQDDSKRKDQKIDELRAELNRLRDQMIELQREVRLNSIYRCERLACADRMPPISSSAEQPSQALSASDRSEAYNAAEPAPRQDI